MLLQGAINRFNLAGVLQFLAQNSSTGVLEVRDFEEYGFIYLVDGQVEAISLPLTDEKLGTRLVKAGCLDAQQLAATLMEEAELTRDEKRLAPLGQRLIEKGFTDEAKIREVMAMQTTDQVFELAHWQTGVFLYAEPERMPHFQVAIQGNVQELLLDAYRRIDEGERSRKTALEVANEVCYACPIASECTEEIRRKHLKPDVCQWRELGAVLDDGYERLRDARQLYRSKGDDDARSLLDASLSSE
ncbi:MAG TPA: DUF4388 domain-containing protein [Thermoleophilia bacterium]|nr:DUF4388 domain-containing protein [Thermoleophilia bacterium]